MPNYNCPAWKLLDAENRYPYWHALEHFHNFSRERLYSLTKQTGFSVLQYGISERFRVCMEVIFTARPMSYYGLRRMVSASL
jgi:hypothetical protein